MMLLIVFSPFFRSSELLKREILIDRRQISACGPLLYAIIAGLNSEYGSVLSKRVRVLDVPMSHEALCECMGIKEVPEKNWNNAK